jgi:hypothetical protein
MDIVCLKVGEGQKWSMGDRGRWGDESDVARVVV